VLVARNRHLLGISFGLLCVSGLVLEAGDLVRRHSSVIVGLQNHYSERISLKERIGLRENEESADVKKLHEASFFTKKIPEPAAVARVKPSLGVEYQKLYFGNLWDLLWYTDFMGADAAFYSAVKAAIETGGLRESDDCLRFQACELSDKAIPLSAANAERLFHLLRKKYVDKAILAYEDLATAEAKQLVVDGANLTRRFRIATDAELSTTRAYNGLVVPLAFMSKYSMSRSSPRVDDIRSLLKMAQGDDAEDEDVEDIEIKTYMRGVGLMRAGCFLDASKAFEEGVATASKGLPLELFSFMAMRSLARPFLEVYREGVVSANSDKPEAALVLDCDESKDASVYTSGFSRLEKRLSSGITHQGLLADLAHYRNRMPFSERSLSDLLSSLSSGDERVYASGKAEVETEFRWSWEGGVAYIVKASDTVDDLSRRYHVPKGAIVEANKLNSGDLSAGQRIVIPRMERISPANNEVVVRAQSNPSGLRSDLKGQFDVRQPEAQTQHGEPDDRIIQVQRTLSQFGYGKLKPSGILDPETAAAIRKFEKERKLPSSGRITEKLVRELSVLTGKKDLNVSQTKLAAAVVSPAVADLKLPSSKLESSTVPPTAGGPPYSWPARGRIISVYGAKTDGKANDGINIALPLGTPVKAADDAIVAYSGNELRGYGNLVLLRHSNGFVTAYAHLNELLVKQGDTVTRGHLIGKSGQSGEADSPQLHFEVRKGSAPLDPVPLLDSAI